MEDSLGALAKRKTKQQTIKGRTWIICNFIFNVKIKINIYGDIYKTNTESVDQLLETLRSILPAK